MEQTRRELIIANVKDLLAGLMYYDRKEDEELGVGEIEAAITNNEITAQEIADVFAQEPFKICNLHQIPTHQG